MLKSKISGLVQEPILPDFPDDDNTVTTTITKSRRVSFGTNFVKEFIVGSAVSQCIGEYEQAFPSSDSSNADSSHSVAESDIVDHSAFVHENHNPHKPMISGVNQTSEPDPMENRPKPTPKFSSTICFSADSPTADMEFTEGCITLAKSILDKKNKEMTVIIQAKPKETKDEEKPKEDETKFFDGSQFEMSVTRCLKSKENKREEKRFESEKTNIFSKFEDEMSITKCNKIFNNDESDSWEGRKENRMPLDMIMRHLDKDNSDLENDLFNPEKSFSNLLNPNPFDFSNDSEKLNLNESMDISTDFQPNIFKNLNKTFFDENPNDAKENELKNTENVVANESMEMSSEIQSSGSDNPDILNLANDKTSNSDEFEKISRDSEPVQLNQVQPEFNEWPNMSMETTPVDLTKAVETPLKSESNIVDNKTINTEESLKETKELELNLEKENKDEKSIDEKFENQNDSEKLILNESQKAEDFHCISNSKTETNAASELMESINISEHMPSHEKIINSQSLESEKSEIPTLNETKISESVSCEQVIIEKSMNVNMSNELNTDSAMDFTLELQPQPDGSQNSKTDEPMEVCSEKARTPETTNATDDLIVNNDDGLKQNLEEGMEISYDIQQNVIEASENPTENISEKPNASESIDITANVEINEIKSPQNSVTEPNTSEESVEIREPSLVDIRVIENLKEQAKEPGCIWSFKDLRHPQAKAPGLLSFDCKLLESSTTVEFFLKMSHENNLNSCSLVTNSEINLNEEKQCRLPEYELVIGFGFQELKKFFEYRRNEVGTIRHIPYFLDQINSCIIKMNSCLLQIHSILTLYPGSRLKGSQLSFRFYSFPIFFSCVVSVDLTDIFRLSKSSISFENDFGSLDERKIKNIFHECLKHENALCEFVIQSTKYLIELEKESGYVSKRNHIRLLPAELKF